MKNKIIRVLEKYLNSYWNSVTDNTKELIAEEIMGTITEQGEGEEDVRKFVDDWLWDPEKYGMERVTSGMPWKREYIADVMSMCIAYAIQKTGRSE